MLKPGQLVVVTKTHSTTNVDSPQEWSWLEAGQKAMILSIRELSIQFSEPAPIGPTRFTSFNLLLDGKNVRADYIKYEPLLKPC